MPNTLIAPEQTRDDLQDAVSSAMRVKDDARDAYYASLSTPGADMTAFALAREDAQRAFSIAVDRLNAFDDAAARAQEARRATIAREADVTLAERKSEAHEAMQRWHPHVVDMLRVLLLEVNDKLVVPIAAYVAAQQDADTLNGRVVQYDVGERVWTYDPALAPLMEEITRYTNARQSV